MDTTRVEANFLVLDIHDRIADLFEEDDPGAAEAIRQAARAFIEGEETMDEVWESFRRLAKPHVREAIDRAESYCKAIAAKLREQEQERPL